jgi:hypothetical protein
VNEEDLNIDGNYAFRTRNNLYDRINLVGFLSALQAISNEAHFIEQSISAKNDYIKTLEGQNRLLKAKLIVAEAKNERI